MGQSASTEGGRRGRAEVLDAAERGSAAPQAELGTSLSCGLNGVERDVSQAAVWLPNANAAAQEGDTLAQTRLDSVAAGIPSSSTTVLRVHTDADSSGGDHSTSDADSLGETSTTAFIEGVGRGLHSSTFQLNLSQF